MARPTFPPIFSYPESDAFRPVGDGTSRPVGLTIAQLMELFFRVRLWKVTSNSDVLMSAVSGIPPTTFYTNDVNNLVCPIALGVFYAGNILSDFYCTLSDYWGMAREAGGVVPSAYNSRTSTFTASSPTLSASTLGLATVFNYTDAEIRALFSVSGFLQSAQFVMSNNGAMQDGLYYPQITLRKNTENGTIVSAYTEYGTPVAYGTATIKLLSGDVTLPIGLLIPSYQTLVSASIDMTVEAVKFWPYKDAADVALYDEDTGAQV